MTKQDYVLGALLLALLVSVLCHIAVIRGMRKLRKDLNEIGAHAGIMLPGTDEDPIWPNMPKGGLLAPDFMDWLFGEGKYRRIRRTARR